MKNFGRNLLDYSFITSVIIKGIDGLIELLSGLIFLFIKISTLNQFAAFITSHELTQDPNDIIANALLTATHNLSVSFKIFVGLYLLIHGLIKIVLVIALLKDKLWAYPVSIAFLIIFIFYQTGHYLHTPSLGVLLLTIFDVIVTILVWQEYKKQTIKYAHKI
ncbi:MAG: DUF2127 domain-containing protein [Candidatus Buchananbacteria bacterium]|nr:DUF2127 domain-containing protein [Candidatus Buchananbacteria bacterium]